MLTFDVLTLFPQLIENHISEMPFKRAIDEQLIKINLHNFREFTNDVRNTVDAKPFGGGVGMLLKIEPIYKALHNIYAKSPQEFSKIIDNQTFQKIDINEKSKVLMMSPRGDLLTQEKAKNLSQKYEQITIICGRYEGIDERVKQIAAIEEISIGNYVLSGGELPALVTMEATTRLIPGVIEKEEATLYESHQSGNLEHPQYTRPANFKGLEVPAILLSGDHKKIEEWKNNNSKETNPTK